VQDRARAAAFHCRGHTKSRITVTNFAESTAIPHLIHNVLAHLPALAPHHPLTAVYFPAQLAAGAIPAPPLPTALTVDDVNSLLMTDTHREWRAPPTLRGLQVSTAPLLSIKTSPTTCSPAPSSPNAISNVLLSNRIDCTTACSIPTTYGILQYPAKRLLLTRSPRMGAASTGSQSWKSTSRWPFKATVVCRRDSAISASDLEPESPAYMECDTDAGMEWQCAASAKWEREWEWFQW